MCDQQTVTIVIPARDAELDLRRLFRSIDDHLPGEIPSRVVLVDNGSSDRTVETAVEYGCETVQAAGVNVSTLRNIGAAKADNGVLLFLDSDVSLTRDWQLSFPKLLRELQSAPRTVAGSWVSVPPDSTWLEESWFRPLEHERHTHVNSAHMIVTKEFFDELGGFSTELASGEDFELSKRAEDMGGRLRNIAALRVFHHGYPKTLRGFWKREVWHGGGDALRLSYVLRSKVAVAAVIVATAELLSLATAIAGSWLAAVASAAVAVAICFGAALKKYRHAGLVNVLRNTFIYFVYFNARAWSVVAGLAGAKHKQGPSR